MSQALLPTAGAFAAAFLGMVMSTTPAAAERHSAVIGDLQWALTTNGSYVRWPDAERYCADLELDGRDDWRLPTMTELETLRDPRSATGIRSPIATDSCCLWSSTSLSERESPDSQEIAGSIDMYRWGYMFDADVAYYAVSAFDDGQALCVRNDLVLPDDVHQ
jgi:hypothetical protein